MIFINLRNLEPTADWKASASDAEDAVAKSGRNRSNELNRHQNVWKSIKDGLRELSHQKCWYCESIDDRSDNAVDHFRPKGNVKDTDPPHAGYWWLAFKHENYRFCCTYCNSVRKGPDGTSGGKQDYFPLADETKRACSRRDKTDREIPLLLDPTKPSDPPLLSFSEDGTAEPSSGSSNSLAHERAKVSIRRYHLNHPDIKERRYAKQRTIRRLILEADDHLEHCEEDETNTYARKNLDERLSDIAEKIRSNSEFSAAVRYTVTGMMESSQVAKMVILHGGIG